MYSKLFASILDSSVWLEPLPTRVIWLTLLAAKDQDGFARFASVENLARRAIVAVEEAETAIAILEAPDPKSSNPAHEGRRVERVPGGWMVLNAGFYDELVRRDDERRMNRDRVRRYREKHKGDGGTAGDADDSPPQGDAEEVPAPENRAPDPTPEPKPAQPMDVLRSIPAIYRGEVEGVLKGHRNPAAVAAELRAMNIGMHGPPRDWMTIGRTVHEILVAGAQVSGLTLRTFCDRLDAPARGNGGNGSKPTKSDRMYEELGAWVEGKEAEEAAAASSAAEVVEAEIEPAPETGMPF